MVLVDINDTELGASVTNFNDSSDTLSPIEQRTTLPPPCETSTDSAEFDIYDGITSVSKDLNSKQNGSSREV
jgi:hypothetical protein